MKGHRWSHPGIMQRRCVAAAREACGDLEMLGLCVAADKAAERTGVSREAALYVLVPLHQRAGHSLQLTADILGVTERTVSRWRKRVRTGYGQPVA